MAQAKWNTQRVSKEIDTLVAKCEVTFDTAVATNNAVAEAWARKALNEARNARASFDAGQFEYVSHAFNAASECKHQAASRI